MNEPYFSRLVEGLANLGYEPPKGDIIRLSGRDGYRARIGNYRIMFDIAENSIFVYKIAPRGQVYKR
jgi:mRNA interferase RelE/StbE